MTAQGDAKNFATAVTVSTFNVESEFKIARAAGQSKMYHHSGLWLLNRSSTAAEVVWFKLSTNSAATVAGDDCWPLRSGERVLVPLVPAIQFISESGTPNVMIAGDMNGQLIYA